MTTNNDWDIESISDRLKTITDMLDKKYEFDKTMLAEELESITIWLRSDHFDGKEAMT